MDVRFLKLTALIFRSGLVLLVSLGIPGCANRPSHPPQFADFRRAFALGMETPEGVARQLAVFEQGALTEAELSAILASSDPVELIGAATQARVQDPLGLKLALRATALDPSRPIVWAALSYKVITLVGNDADGREESLGFLSDALQRWQSLEPSNAVPRYLEARYSLFLTNVSRALELMAMADRMTRFDTHEEPIRTCVEMALRSRGYPRYSALVLASGNATGSLHLTMLGKELLRAAPATAVPMEQLTVLGRRVASGKTMLAELLGLSLQLQAMDRVGSKPLEMERSVLVHRKTYIQRMAKLLMSPALDGVSEERWVQFYEESSSKGEMSATEDLARESWPVPSGPIGSF